MRKKLIIILLVIVANSLIVNFYYTINSFDESKNAYLNFLSPLFYLTYYLYSKQNIK